MEASESIAASHLQEIATPHGSIAPQQQPESGLTLPLLDAQGEVRPLEQLEAEVIRFAIAHYRGQMSEVARRLQIGRSTLYRKLDALGLQQRVAENDTDPCHHRVSIALSPGNTRAKIDQNPRDLLSLRVA